MIKTTQHCKNVIQKCNKFYGPCITFIDEMRCYKIPMVEIYIYLTITLRAPRHLLFYKLGMQSIENVVCAKKLKHQKFFLRDWRRIVILSSLSMATVRVRYMTRIIKHTTKMG